MAIFGAGIDSWISAADGNLSSASTWQKVDPFLQVDEAAWNGSFTEGSRAVIIQTSYQSSSSATTTGSPPTIDGIALKISQVTNVSGTFTVVMDKAGVDVPGTLVTCNVSDLKAPGWHFFKFPAPVTLLASTSYLIKVKTSVASTVNLMCTTPSIILNICRLLRTTTTGVPQNASSQNDNIYTMGEITGAGAVTSRTITWDNTSDAFPFNMLTIGCYSTVTCQASASTNYYMRVQNDLRIYNNGTLNVGSSSTPLPASSTFTLTLHASGQPNQSGCVGLIFLFRSIVNLYGAPKKPWTLLTSDVAAGGTTINVADATGWNIGDTVCVASTTTTAAQSESKVITSVAGNSIGVAALTNAHSGTAPKLAEVGNLTRNIVIKGRSTTQQGYVYYMPTSQATTNIFYGEFTLLGGGSNGYYGIYVDVGSSGTGQVVFDGCSIHDSLNSCMGIYLNSIAPLATVIINNNVLYNLAQAHIYANNVNVCTITSNFCCLNTSGSSNLIHWLSGGPSGTTLSNNRVVSGSNGGFTLNSYYPIIIDGNVAHSCVGQGISFNYGSSDLAMLNVNSSNWTAWCCDRGMIILKEFQVSSFLIDGYTAFSNTISHLQIDRNLTGNIRFNNFNLQGGSAPVTPAGIRHGGSWYITVDLSITNSQIGNITPHSTADINFPLPVHAKVYLANTILGSPTPVSGYSNLVLSGIVTADRYQQIDGNYAVFYRYGILTRDDTIYRTTTPSIRLTPKDYLNRVASSPFYAPVKGGTTVTVSVAVRRSVAGDGQAHNGNFPRLILGPNNAAGLSGETVLATATSDSNGAWQVLSGVVGPLTGDSIISFYVDVDSGISPNGWINIDDASATPTYDTSGMNYAYGGPYVNLGTGGQTTTRYIPISRRKLV